MYEGGVPPSHKPAADAAASAPQLLERLLDLQLHLSSLEDRHKDHSHRPTSTPPLHDADNDMLGDEIHLCHRAGFTDTELEEYIVR